MTNIGGELSINLKVQTQNLREKGSSTKHIATNLAGMHDNFEQISRALDYDVKYHVLNDITTCLRLLQDNYNLVGDYAKGLIDAANAYDKREEELFTMFDHLEIETLGKGIEWTQDIEKDDNERPKAGIETRDRHWVRSPREPLDIFNEDVTFLNMAASSSDGGWYSNTAYDSNGNGIPDYVEDYLEINEGTNQYRDPDFMSIHEEMWRLLMDETSQLNETYITKAQLQELYVNTVVTDKMITDLNDTIIKYDITSPERISHFLGQTMKESGQGRWITELYNGDPVEYFTKKYENRSDLGNDQPGDGFRFRGAGYIQVTGRNNYQAFADTFDDETIKDRIMTEGADYVIENYPWRASGFWWHDNGMNAIVDRGTTVKEVTSKVNYNLKYQSDYQEQIKIRTKYYNQVKEIFK